LAAPMTTKATTAAVTVQGQARPFFGFAAAGARGGG
jgi:hypothetical protein